VAALMASAAAVIAEKGFEATTMAEIALRAGAPIGSLYRFFPNKAALAEALLVRYQKIVQEAFEKIESGIKTMSSAELADALLRLFVELRSETQAIVQLLEVDSPLRGEFRKRVHGYIARLLKARLPRLSAATSESMAVVLVHNMKFMKVLKADPGMRAAAAELQEMTRLYLTEKLGA
jgi:AcrR family transcriptional regulator